MNASRAEQALDSVSALAQKTYEAVPAQEGWTRHQIRSEMLRLHGTAPAVDVVEGCLGALINQKLVRRSADGTFTRTPVRARVQVVKAADAQAISAAAQEPKPAANEPEAAPEAQEPMDMIGSLAQRLREKAATLIAMADELDEVALAVEERIEKVKADSAKLVQLRELLKVL